MYFVAEIKPTSTLHQRWSNRNLRCGVLQGVGFVRKGRTYVAEKVSPSEMEMLKREVAVRFAATAIRTTEKFSAEAPAKTQINMVMSGGNMPSNSGFSSGVGVGGGDGAGDA